ELAHRAFPAGADLKHGLGRDAPRKASEEALVELANKGETLCVLLKPVRMPGLPLGFEIRRERRDCLWPRPADSSSDHMGREYSGASIHDKRRHVPVAKQDTSCAKGDRARDSKLADDCADHALREVVSEKLPRDWTVTHDLQTLPGERAVLNVFIAS